MLLTLGLTFRIKIATDVNQILDYLQPLALPRSKSPLSFIPIAYLHTTVPENHILDLLLPLLRVYFAEEGVMPGLPNIRQCKIWQYLHTLGQPDSMPLDKDLQPVHTFGFESVAAPTAHPDQ